MADEGNRALAEVVAEQVATPEAREKARKRAKTMTWLVVVGLPVFAISELAGILTRSFPWWIAVPWGVSLVLFGIGSVYWNRRLWAWIAKNWLP